MKMLKTVAALILAISLIAAAAGCGKKDDQAQSAQPSADKYKESAYTALRMTEDKVNTIFAKDTAKDGSPIISASVGSVDSAKQLLSYYMEAPIADAVIQHYVTDKKADGAVVVSDKPFFDPSVLATTLADVTFDGTQDDVKIKTKEGAVYEMKWENNKYVLANISK